MDKYEYKAFEFNMNLLWGGSVSVNTNELQNQLNILGNDGWELVSSSSTAGYQGRGNSVVCILKRKKV